MNTITVRAILRIVAVLMIFASGIGVCLSAIGTWSMNRFMQANTPGVDVHLSLSGIGQYAVLSWLVICLAGVLLYAVSTTIARHIVGGPPSTRAVLDLREHGQVAPG